MFLLVPAHPGFPGQIPQSRKTVVCVCVCRPCLMVCHFHCQQYCQSDVFHITDWQHISYIMCHDICLYAGEVSEMNAAVDVHTTSSDSTSSPCSSLPTDAAAAATAAVTVTADVIAAGSSVPQPTARCAIHCVYVTVYCCSTARCL